jgi:hypothetical protein
MFDKNLLLRQSTDGALSASELARAGVDFGAGDRKGFTYIVKIPSVSGTTPTCAVKIQDSPDNSTWTDLLSFPSITAVGMYYRSARSSQRYRRAYITLGGTTPNFGTAIIGVDLGGDQDKF